MKKLIAVLLTLLLLITFSSQVDAAAIGHINLKDKATIKAMKNGTMSFKGVKLGSTVKTAKKKWNNDYTPVKSSYQYYDYLFIYDIETDDDYDTFEAYFNGKRGMKTTDFKMDWIKYYGSSSMLKYKDMKKYWGKPDFTYVTAGEEVFFFGQAALVYDDNDGAFLGYKYTTKASVKAIKRAYLK